jgi:hypothetical protein
MYIVIAVKDNKVKFAKNAVCIDDAMKLFEAYCFTCIPSVSKYTREYIDNIKNEGYHRFGESSFIQIYFCNNDSYDMK